ncbi:MAG: hypothetical protein WCD36_10060 [Rhodanobacteraceae bacterium]
MNLRTVLLILATGLLATGMAQAADQKAKAKSSPPAAQSGVKIYIDPATGEWSQTPVTAEQQHNAAASALPADASKVTQVMHADGSIEYRMNGQGMTAVTATRGADGKLHIMCSEHGLEHVHTAQPALEKGEPDER